MALCAGLARKLSIPLVIFSIVGWILFVIGFALINNRHPIGNGVPHSASENFFPYWGFVIGAPVLFVNTFVNLCIGRWYTGIFTHFVTVFVLICLGGVVYMDSLTLWSGFSADSVTNPDEFLYWLIEWIGAMLTTLALTVFMTVWPLFKDNSKDDDYV